MNEELKKLLRWMLEQPDDKVVDMNQSIKYRDHDSCGCIMVQYGFERFSPNGIVCSCDEYRVIDDEFRHEIIDLGVNIRTLFSGLEWSKKYRYEELKRMLKDEVCAELEA